MRNELMIDIETTGQRVGCKVLSLGAFGFDKDGQQVDFYKRFNATVQADEGLVDDDSTMEWWNRQDPATRAEAFGGTTMPTAGIGEFEHWFYDHFSTGKHDRFRVWCCGLDFDFPILQNFFKVYGFSFPWFFWTQYDYRTVKNLYPDVVKPAEGNVVKHNALEDCKAQMRGLRAFYQM